MTGGWSPHPSGRNISSDSIKSEKESVPGGLPVRIAAYCELGPGDDRTQSFFVSELLYFASGAIAILHSERGVTLGETIGAIGSRLSADSVIEAVLAATLPEDDNGESHDWEWLASLAKKRNIDVTSGELSELPYDIILSGDVISRLRDFENR